MKFAFIAKHRGIWPAVWMCEALGVSRGGFRAWLKRPRSARSVSDEELGAKVYVSFLASDRTYGARRVWHDMLELGERCGLHRIERLLRHQALKAGPRGVGCRPTWVSGQASRRRSQRAGSFLLCHRSQPPLDCGLYLYLDGRRLALRRRRHRTVLPARRGLVDERENNG